MTRALSRKHAGETMTLTIYRNGRSMDVKVTLAARRRRRGSKWGGANRSVTVAARNRAAAATD